MATGWWDALGLGGSGAGMGDMGGMGRVDIRGATPPIGKTGTGGVEGMGLMALLRRLSMGLDDGKGPEELPTPSSPDPASANAIGKQDQLQSSDSYNWGGLARGIGVASQGGSPVEAFMAGLGGRGMDRGRRMDPGMGQPIAPDPSMMTGMGPGMGAAPMANMLPMGGGMPAGMGQDVGFPQLPPTATSMGPEQQRMAYEEEMRRLGMPGF